MVYTPRTEYRLSRRPSGRRLAGHAGADGPSIQYAPRRPFARVDRIVGRDIYSHTLWGTMGGRGMEQGDAEISFSEIDVESLQGKLDAFGATLTAREAAAFAACFSMYVEPEVRGYVAPDHRLRHTRWPDADEFAPADSRTVFVPLLTPAGKLIHVRVRR